MDNETSELDYFSRLSSREKGLRINSVRGILKKIKHNTKHSEREAYLICKRLIRGLGGSNATFRQGCFCSVVGLLKLLPPNFNISLIEEIITNELGPTGNNSKQEEGEGYLGQILAYGAMVISDFIFYKPEDDQFRVFEKLFQLSQKRSYLHHVSFVFLTMFIKKVKKELNPDGFLDHMNDLDTYTLDKLNYIVALSDVLGKTAVTRKIFETKRLYDLKNCNALASLVKKNKSPKMYEHDFFKNFITSVYKHKQFLTTFWSVFCDLKSSKDGFDTKTDKAHNSLDVLILYVASQLFKVLRENQDGILAFELFNKCFLGLLIRNAKKEKKLVHSILNDFCAAVKSVEDNIKINFLKQILFEDGLINFDNVTNSKMIITLTNGLSFTGISVLADLYKEVLEFKREVSEFESRNKAIIFCLNYFTKLINNPVCYEETNWRLSQLVYLLKMGFFKLPDFHINREFRTQLQEAFLTSLGHRFPNLDSFQHVLEGLVKEMNIMLQKKDTVPVVKFTDEMKDAWESSITLGEEINKYMQSETERKEIVLVLKLILQYMAILLLKEPSTATTNIQDLHNIYEDLLKETDENADKMWIEVLIDLFLNLLSKPFYHHRHLIRSTFKPICPYLTLKSFMQIVEVLTLSYDSEDINDDDDDVLNESGSDSSKNSEDEEAETECSDEEISKNEKLRFELRNVLGGGSDNESIDLDEMDEEEGKKLDEALSNVFRANIRRKKTDHMSKYQNQLAHFRTRVMDLIEICTEVAIPFSYWLKVLIPLVDLLGSTVGQSKLDCLRARITCCIKKLNSSKVVHDESSVPEIVKILENIFDKASKSSGIYADIKLELVQVIKFILKASKPFKKGLKIKHLDENTIFQCYKKYLDGFFLGKNNLPIQLFTGLTSIGWDGMLALVPEILRYSFDSNVKIHRKLTGLKIIDIFCKTPQYFDGHLEKYYKLYLPQVEDDFTSSVIQELNNINQTKELNMKYYSDLWALLASIVSRQRNSQMQQIIDTDQIKASLEEVVNELPTMKGKCKQNFRKLCNTLSIKFPINKDNVLHLEKESIINQETAKGSPKSLLKRKRKGDIIKKKKKMKTMKPCVV